MAAIRSMLDNDLYKFTMMWAVRSRFPRVPVRYLFNNRRKEGKFNGDFEKRFRQELDALGELRANDDELQWFAVKCPFIHPCYFDTLRYFRFKTNEISAKVAQGELELSIDGFWDEHILDEVPLMALISESFFETCDTDWKSTNYGDLQTQLLHQKWHKLRGLKYTDFGTRRRRSFESQERVVSTFRSLDAMHGEKNFVGTSNVHLARLYDTTPIGTMAHEWIMGVSALESLQRANYYALKIWSEVYGGDLGTALTDTFGSDVFFRDFDTPLAHMFDSVRHDSGDPFVFGEKAIAFYEKIGIPPITKSIIYSDGLDCETAVKLYEAFHKRIRLGFGIGTHFTNDYANSKALNMVIKLAMCGGKHVVKLSDVRTKQIGDRDALRVANYVFNGVPLDAVA